MSDKTQITRYTTTSAIRACIGVDASDCPDVYLLDSHLDTELEVDLDSWLPDHSTLFDTGTASGSTAEEKRVADYICLYAQWFGAYEMASRFLAFPQIETDGKNQINRFANIEMQDVAKNAAARMAKYRGLLDEVVNGAVLSAVPNLISVSSPGTDPVTDF